MCVHGGITYAGFRSFGSMYWWVGFDCAHACDSPSLCDEAYVVAQLNILAEQLVRVKSIYDAADL